MLNRKFQQNLSCPVDGLRWYFISVEFAYFTIQSRTDRSDQGIRTGFVKPIAFFEEISWNNEDLSHQCSIEVIQKQVLICCFLSVRFFSTGILLVSIQIVVVHNPEVNAYIGFTSLE